MTTTTQNATDHRQTPEWRAIRADTLMMDEIDSRDSLYLTDAIYNAIKRLERRLGTILAAGVKEAEREQPRAAGSGTEGGVLIGGG